LLVISELVLKHQLRLSVLNHFASKTFQLQGKLKQKQEKHLNVCRSLVQVANYEKDRRVKDQTLYSLHSKVNSI
jgi:hypothetical protein